MLKALSKILGFISSIFDFFLNFLESLLVALQTLSESLELPLQMVGFMPSIIGASIAIVISIMVVKFVLGR